MALIDQFPDNLPESPEKIESAFQDCQKKKREIIKTKTFVEISKEEYRSYVDSAINALKAAQVLFDNECFEWVIVPAYSAIYQAGNAIIIKELGRECRDHFCLLVTLLKLKKIGWEEVQDVSELKDKLAKVPEEEIRFASKLRLARSAVIYKPALSYNEELIAKEVIQKSKRLVNHFLEVL